MGCLGAPLALSGLSLGCRFGPSELDFSDCAWIMYGSCMDYVWMTYGLCLDDVWVMPGLCQIMLETGLPTKRALSADGYGKARRQH